MVNKNDILKNADYSTYEYTYSLQVMEKIKEKKVQLLKVVTEIDKTILANRTVVSAQTNYTLNEIMTMKKTNINKLNVIQENIENESAIIEVGVKIVKMISVQNTLFTKLQLLITGESFANVTNDQITKMKYLIDYGRNLLLEVIS